MKNKNVIDSNVPIVVLKQKDEREVYLCNLAEPEDTTKEFILMSYSPSKLRQLKETVRVNLPKDGCSPECLNNILLKVIELGLKNKKYFNKYLYTAEKANSMGVIVSSETNKSSDDEYVIFEMTKDNINFYLL